MSLAVKIKKKKKKFILYFVGLYMLLFLKTGGKDNIQV